jgi:hypothetical protein
MNTHQMKLTIATALTAQVLVSAACGAESVNNSEPLAPARSPEIASSVEVRTAAQSTAAAAALYEASPPPSLVAYPAWQVFEGSEPVSYHLTGESFPMTLQTDEDGFLFHGATVDFDAPPPAALRIQEASTLALPQVLIFSESFDPSTLTILDAAAFDSDAVLGISHTELVYISPSSLTPEFEEMGYVAGVNSNVSDDAGRIPWGGISTATAADWVGFGLAPILLKR